VAEDVVNLLEIVNIDVGQAKSVIISALPVDLVGQHLQEGSGIDGSGKMVGAGEDPFLFQQLPYFGDEGGYYEEEGEGCAVFPDNE